jgi:hypothetical protein
MVHLNSTKTSVLGRTTTTTRLISVSFVFLLCFAEAATFKSDALQKLHQSFVSVLGKSRTLSLTEDHKTTIN